ncbi:MAG: hypothetical protein RLZZ502_1902, partial [Pseudomonadota bacterium]
MIDEDTLTEDFIPERAIADRGTHL